MKKRIIGILAGLMILSAVGCETKPVTEASGNTTAVESSVTEASGNTTVTESSVTETEPVVTETEPVTDDDPALAYSGSMAFHEARLPFRTRPELVTGYDYDERYVLFVTWEGIREDESGESFRYGTQLAVLDKKNGEFLPDLFRLADISLASFCSIDYEAGFCVLYAARLIEETAQYVVEAAYRIAEEDGVFRVEETEWNAYPENQRRYSSPDGRYTVYRMVADGYGSGEILLRESGGRVRETLIDTTLTPGRDVGVFRAYVPVGFIDDTHFLYNICGWEWNVGYGLYDVQTDTVKEWNNGQSVIGIDRAAQKLITQKLCDDYTVEWYECTLSGEETFICHDESSQYGRMDTGEAPSYYGGHWLRVSPEKIEILTDDRTETAAVIEGTDGVGIWAAYPYAYFLHIYENTVTVVYGVGD